MQRADKNYKDLKQKQKSVIADKTYSMYLTFYLENQRMPDVSEMNDICKRLFATVQVLAPKTGYEDIYNKRFELSEDELNLRLKALAFDNGIVIKKSKTFSAKPEKKI